MNKRRIISHSSDETLRLAEKIGRRLRGGEVIELVSDLGGGKTTFVRGIARGISSKDKVHSPSFTLSNEYHGTTLKLYHFDFYRLAEPGIMRDELTEAIGDRQSVVTVEWGDIVETVLPKTRLSITLKPVGPDSRELSFRYPDQLEYLLKNT